MIIATNDSHGQLLPREVAGRPIGGVAAMAVYFDSVRAEAGGCPVFLFSAGDMLQGTLISNMVDGESTIAAFNALGYDAAAFGNHEFDWGVEVLKQRLAQASFPFLGANIFEAGTGRHPEWARPYAIVERDGVRLGVIGAITRSTPWTTFPTNVSDLEFGSIAEAVDRYAPVLREQGVDFVVLVMHAGGRCVRHDSCHGEAVDELMAMSAKVDYAIAGHDHEQPLRERVAGIQVSQGLPYTEAFTVGHLERDANGALGARLEEVVTPYADVVRPDFALLAVVSRYQDRMEELSERPVAALAQPLRRSPGEHPLGNLLVDAERAATRSQVAIINNGAVRQNLPGGQITYADLYAVQPFENSLVILTLRGTVLWRALEHSLRTGRPKAHIAGLVVEYDREARMGDRVLSARLEDGASLHVDSLYTVTVPDFLLAGGDGFDMLAEHERVEDTGILDLDATIAYLRSLPQPVEPPAVGRWQVGVRVTGNR